MKPPRVTGEPTAVIADHVNRLIRKFEYPDSDTIPLNPILGGGGGAPTVVIATPGSSGFSQGRADFVLGLDLSPGGFQILLNGFTGLRARILFTEGDFAIDTHIDVPTGIDFEGAGRRASRLTWGADPDITFAGDNGLRNIALIEVAT